MFRKIPVLVDLPVVEQEQQSLVLRAKTRIAELDFAKFNFRKSLGNFFKESHIFIFKIENKIGSGLEKIKKNHGQNKQSENNIMHNDNYWKELKKHKEKNNK